MTPDDYCANLIGGRGSSFYYSLMFLPLSMRRAANAVYAFVHETNAIADECHDPSVARIKLEWWREEILRTYAGAPRHPVTQALAPVIAAHAFERVHFLTLLAATETTLGRMRIEKFESLRDHCQHIGSTPALLTATVFGITDPATRLYAETLGVALRLTEILSNLGQDVRHDRLYLPAEDLGRFDVTETDILACRHTPAFEALMAFQTERALRHYDQALGQLPPVDHTHQLPGLIMTAIARTHLDEVRRDGFRVLERRLALPPLRKLWIAWKTRARERRHARLRHSGTLSNGNP